MTAVKESRSRLGEVAEGRLAESLSGAIRVFNERTEALRHEYERLRGEFERVNVELELRNRQLAESLAKEESLRAHLASVLESLSVGVVACDTEGRVTLVNPAMEGLSGYRAAALRGRPVPAGFPLAAGTGARELTRADAEAIPVECDTVVMQGARGEPCGWVMLVRDLRPVRELEQEVERSRTLAALGELAAGIVHEVRNPLGAIEGFGSLLLRALEPEDTRHRLAAKLLGGVRDLKRIVDDLLVLARPAALHLRPVGLQEIVTHSMDLALNGWGEGSAAIELQVVRAPEELTVLADPRTLTQVLVNLLRNAAEAMPEGGRLRVQAEAAGEDAAVVSVTDSGAGIPAPLREKIFDAFFTTKEKGTGLGLFIARTIARAHGGEITIEGAEGGGTRVRLRLARVAGSRQAAA